MASTATRPGLLLGADLGAEGLPPVTGNSMIVIDLAVLDGEARFTDLQTLFSGVATPFRKPTLTYNVSIAGNAFEDADRRVHGAWFGNSHGEIAGTLLDERPIVNLIAGFGGTLEENPN